MATLIDTDPTFSAQAPAAYTKTKLTKPALLKRYREQIATSMKWRKDEGYDDTWHRLIDLYRGKHFTEGEVTGEDRIAINVAFSTVNVIGPSVAINHPKISVLARLPELEQQAILVEAATNYWWRHYNFKPEFRLAVDDFLIIGHGWGKVGYRYVTEKVALTPEEQGQRFEELDLEQQEYATANPELAAEMPTPQDMLGSVPAQEERVVEDRPFMERASPFDIFVDPEATCEADMKWIAQRIVRPLEDAQRDPAYNRAARRKIQGDASTNPRWRDEESSNGKGGKYSDDVKRCTIWEYYDIRHSLMCVFSDGASDGDFLVDPDAMPYSYGQPYRMLRNYEVPDQFYPIGDLEQIEPMQRELNLTRSAMMNHRKRYARKYFAREDALDEAGKTALTSNQDNEIVFVQGDVPFDELVQPVPIISLDPQLYEYSAVIQGDVDLVSGVSEYQRGSISETRRTATEASIIQDSVNARAEEKLAIVEDFVASIAAAVVQLAQTYLTGDQVARITGPEGQVQWIEFDRESIQGEFDFEVEAGSTQPRNETQRRQQALQLANVLSPYIGIPGGVNPTPLIMHVLREGFGVQDPERFIMPMMAPPQVDEDGNPIEEDPNAPQEGAPPNSAGEEALALPTPGPQAMPPGALLALQQLEGQVGLSLPNSA